MATAYVMFALASGTVAFQSTMASSSVSEKVSARTFEVLNADGNVAARIGANEFGGTFELFRTDKGEEPRAIIWAGSMLPGGAEIMVTAPDESESSVSLSVNGEPATPSISGTFGKTTPSFKIGSRNDDYPVLKLWNADGKTVRFEK